VTAILLYTYKEVSGPDAETLPFRTCRYRAATLKSNFGETQRRKCTHLGAKNQRCWTVRPESRPARANARSKSHAERRPNRIVRRAGIDWYTLPHIHPDLLEMRLTLQSETFIALSQRSLSQRMGQTLEIATYKALLQLENGVFFGRFKDLEEHDDDQIYKKEEPPQHLGSRQLEGDERLDFLVSAPSGTWLGVECKNVREWLYPDRDEIRDMIDKCLRLNCVPVYCWETDSVRYVSPSPALRSDYSPDIQSTLPRLG
jgi:hypothetical protein